MRDQRGCVRLPGLPILHGWRETCVLRGRLLSRQVSRDPHQEAAAADRGLRQASSFDGINHPVALSFAYSGSHPCSVGAVVYLHSGAASARTFVDEPPTSICGGQHPALRMPLPRLIRAPRLVSTTDRRRGTASLIESSSAAAHLWQISLSLITLNRSQAAVSPHWPRPEVPWPIVVHDVAHWQSHPERCLSHSRLLYIVNLAAKRLNKCWEETSLQALYDFGSRR